MQILRIVRSKAGRDKDRLFIVSKDEQNGYLEIVDGMLRKVDKPKRKKQRHIETVLESYEYEDGELTNKAAARIIKKISAELNCKSAVS